MKNNSGIKVNWLVYNIVAKGLCAFLTWKYNIKYKFYNGIKKINGPITLISNHVGFWDPFIIAYPLKQKIQYITSDNIFRGKIMKTLMNLLGSIPKTKFKEDRLSIINVFKTVKNGGSIGIFPEGRRSFDGSSIEIIKSTVKLIKRMGLPLIGAKIHGGFLSFPRWAIFKRRGKILISYKILLKAEEIQNLSENKILNIIQDHILFNEYEYQAKKLIAFKGKNFAENLEQLLYICPKCNQIASLYSNGNNISCTKCKYQVKLNKFGFFEEISEKPLFKNPYLQNKWQKTKTKTIIANIKNEDTPIFSDKDAHFFTGYRAKPLEHIFSGKCTLTKKEIQFYNEQIPNQIKKFQISQIEGINIQNKEKLEFYYDNTLYRISFVSKKISLYKYFIAINLIKENTTTT